MLKFESHKYNVMIAYVVYIIFRFDELITYLFVYNHYTCLDTFKYRIDVDSLMTVIKYLNIKHELLSPKLSVLISI